MHDKIGLALSTRLNTIRAHDTLDVNIFLKGEPARESLAATKGIFLATTDGREAAPSSADRDEVVQQIKARAARHQENLLTFLREQGEKMQTVDTVITITEPCFSASLPPAARVRPYWITNSIFAQVTPEMLRPILERDDVEHVELVRHADLSELLDGVRTAANVRAPQDVDPPVAGDVRGLDVTSQTTWNVRRVNAPLLWQQGLTGKGILVAVIDSGVNYNHPDLRGRMWDGGAEYPRHGIDTEFPDLDPMDENGDGHGTASAGIVAGDGTSGRKTGVAPGATLMAIRVWGKENNHWAGMQFAIDRGVHVISMSVTWKHQDYPTYIGWRRMSESIASAGILHANSIGNQGNELQDCPLPYNIATPGNCPPPWLHPAQSPVGGVASAISCGATDDRDELSGRSGRGPSAWEIHPYTDYPYAGGGLIKPDVCAPGSVSLSCNWRFGLVPGAPPYTRHGGTSAATPHVAGCLALLAEACVRSGNPIVPARMQEALERTAARIRGQKREKEPHYGAGRIDAYEAFKYGVQRSWWR